MINDFFEEALFSGAALTLLAYELGLLLKRRFRSAIFNPILIAVICVIALLKLLNIEYSSYESGAKYISYLLTPATVCLALPLYEELKLLKDNLAAVACGILSGILSGMAGVFLLCKIFRLSHTQYVTLLPKSVTTAIGMGISEELGGTVTITVAVIIITGIFGNIFADFIFSALKIKEPVAKGIALGTCSHAIGTARAMELGEAEGAMSSLAIAVAGILTVVLAPIFSGLPL